MKKELDEKTRSENRCVSTFCAFIFWAAFLNILEAAGKIYLRYKIKDATILNDYQYYLSAGNVAVLIFVFLICIIVVRKADYYTANVKPLLLIWGVILIGASVIYEITSILYSRAISQIFTVTSQKQYIYLYNSTHGFKYIGMMVAITLGTIMTGIMLKSKWLIFLSTFIMTVFIGAFAVFQMYTLNLDFIGKSVGIVWTSVIYHLSETAGLLLMALYVRIKYYKKCK